MPIERRLNDAELVALAAIVNVRCVAAAGENEFRRSDGSAPAYSEGWQPEEASLIEAELRSRGVYGD